MGVAVVVAVVQSGTGEEKSVGATVETRCVGKGESVWRERQREREKEAVKEQVNNLLSLTLTIKNKHRVNLVWLVRLRVGR